MRCIVPILSTNARGLSLAARCESVHHFPYYANKSLSARLLFMTEREQQILAILRDEPLIAQQALAQRLGISRSAVAGHIMNLTQKGHILGKGYVLADQRFVIVLGGANMDISAATQHAPVPADSNPGAVCCGPGGVARNVAENLARLGIDTRLLAAVGDDAYGRSLLEATQRAGVDVRGCWELSGQTTSTYVSFHGPGGDLVVAVNDMRIMECITPERLDAHADRVRHAAALVVDCNVGAEALSWVFANRGSTHLFVDAVSTIKCMRIAPWLDQVHTLKVNRQEAQALCGMPTQSDEDIQRAVQWLHSRGVQQVVLSLGARGVYWSDKDAGHGFLATLPTEVVNVTGGGDALMAGLVYGFVCHRSLAEVISFALACAALTMGTAQANHPSLSLVSVAQLMRSATQKESA
jgi:pseudouridine kinase